VRLHAVRARLYWTVCLVSAGLSVRVAAQQPAATAAGHFAALRRVASFTVQELKSAPSGRLVPQPRLPSLFHDRVVPELCLSLPDGGTRASCPQLECCNMAAAVLHLFAKAGHVQ